MKLGVCAQVFYHLPFEEALQEAARLGFEAIELPVDARNPFIDLDDALKGGWRRIEQQVREAGLEISALSNHQEGQLLLGPHGEDTDPIHRGNAQEKTAYARIRLRQTAQLAQFLDVSTVCGFTGCQDYSRWFPWPLENGYELMFEGFRETMLPLLDEFAAMGVRFAHECHPRQFAYNLDTAEQAVLLVDNHPAFGFNFDPANLMLAGMEPLCFLDVMGPRIFHVHAKDGERVTAHAARSGLFAHGKWQRKGRGFRFRVPGWGDLNWRKIITELHMNGYAGVLSVEHEDPTMSPREGLQQAVAHLEPILLKDPPPGERWW